MNYIQMDKHLKTIRFFTFMVWIKKQRFILFSFFLGAITLHRTNSAMLVREWCEEEATGIYLNMKPNTKPSYSDKGTNDKR